MNKHSWHGGHAEVLMAETSLTTWSENDQSQGTTSYFGFQFRVSTGVSVVMDIWSIVYSSKQRKNRILGVNVAWLV